MQYAQHTSNFFPTFRDKISPPVSKTKTLVPWKIGRISCAELSVSNYHCMVCNISAERSCCALLNGNLKLRNLK